MAPLGLDSVEVHSKDIVVKYLDVKDHETIHWQIKPIKRSIAFAIWRIPPALSARERAAIVSAREQSQRGATARAQPPRARAATAAAAAAKSSSPKQRSLSSASDGTRMSGILQHKLRSSGLEIVVPWKRSEAGMIERGVFEVGQAMGSTYALIFDNTFSVSISKTVFFIFSTLSCLQQAPAGLDVLPRSPLDPLDTVDENDTAVVYTGTLMKKRRRRLQGFAKRFFALNMITGELNYYLRPTSVHLRGSIPLAMSMAVVTIDPRQRRFIIDSGAEIWELRAIDQEDFHRWKGNIETVRRKLSTPSVQDAACCQSKSDSRHVHLCCHETNVQNRLLTISNRLIDIKNSIEQVSTGSSDTSTKRSLFWKRRPRSLSKPLSLESASPIHQSVVNDNHELKNVCLKIDDLVGMLGRLWSGNDQGARNDDDTLQRRNSFASSVVTHSTKWYDADLDYESVVNCMTVSDSSDSNLASALEYNDAEVSDDSVSTADEDEGRKTRSTMLPLNTLSSNSSQHLYPIDVMGPWNGRTSLPCTFKIAPPSVLNILRKNIGKDMTQVSLPVTMNEPLGLLQRYAEDLEYSELLETAAQTCDYCEAILYVAAFAVSSMSGIRDRQRVMRKAFTPLLGETFELVRPDKGFRFISEKVVHRPPVFACCAESKNFQYTHAPMPKQQFWGKSFQLLTRGLVNIVLHRTGHIYTYNKPTLLVKNIHMGEKYVEPQNLMTIRNESTGDKAIVTFKPAGMFKGRSEEIEVHATDKNGISYSKMLTGKWTEGLALCENGDTACARKIWTVGSLVQCHEDYCGLTTYAASLNDLESVHDRDRLCRTDSRLRPDQRLYELGQTDEADVTKTNLETEQRARRTELDSQGSEWIPRWFVRAGDAGDDIWIPKEGDHSYWVQREKGFQETFKLW